MTSVPKASALIEGVIAFLQNEVATSPDARLAFHGRVAANALAIAGRDMALGDVAERAAANRLQPLLGLLGERDMLDRALCAQIAEGRIDDGNPGLLAHLWFSTMDALSIDQPTYAAYMRALADDPRTAGEE